MNRYEIAYIVNNKPISITIFAENDNIAKTIATNKVGKECSIKRANR